MKAEECQLGIKVYTDDGPRYLYTIEALPDEHGNLKVKPTKESWASGGLDSFHLDDLHLYNEEKLKEMAAKMQAKIDTAKDAFETAFKALKELEDFRGTDSEYVSRYDLSEMDLISIKELEETVECYGWSSSSLWC